MKMDEMMVIDPQDAGVSGDMFLGALIDLGISQDKVRKALSELPSLLKNCKSVELLVNETQKHGIRGVRAEVKVEESYGHRTGAELRDAVREYLRTSDLSGRAKSYASNCLSTILEAEARLHSTTVDDVQLHEVGSADTLADILGVATALDDMGLFENMEAYSLPVNVGRGRVKTSHGILNIPIPVTLEILRLKDFAFKGGVVGGELATPTGVSLLVNLAKQLDVHPLIHPTKVGYGAGSMDIETVPNLLKVVVGHFPTKPLAKEEIYMIETNVDDVSGEIIGHLVERLFEEGAKDVYTIPAIGKGSRPTMIVNAMADSHHVEKITDTLFKETGSLGVRVSRRERFTLEREMSSVNVDVAGKTFKIGLKVARDWTGRIIQIKPEFKDAKKASAETGIPLREVLEAAKKAGERLIA